MTDKPGNIEHFEKQFGIIAIEKGYITSDNLIESLKIQVEEDLFPFLIQNLFHL